MNSEKADIVSNQYDQYWNMYRFHLKLSWQIPAIALAALLAFIKISENQISNWNSSPLLPALMTLVLFVFFLIIYVHHRRNLIFAEHFEVNIGVLEDKYGEKIGGTHTDANENLSGVDSISSSKLLGAFVAFCCIALLFGSSYLWFLYASSFFQ